MVVTKFQWTSMFNSTALLLESNAKYLSELDSIAGDGDHGITISKIAKVIYSCCEEWEDQTPIKDFLENLAYEIIGVNGGSAGPLFGTFIEGLAEGLQRDVEVDAQVLKHMFRTGLDTLADISHAKRGDKTMMDALIPAIEAMESSDDVIEVLLEVAAKAAAEGAESTKESVAKFGRAKNVKERSLGYLDPGAVSMSLIFKGLSNGYQVVEE